MGFVYGRLVQHRYPGAETPAIDTLLETLSHPLRRMTIRYFEHQHGPETATLDTLVAHITGWRSVAVAEAVRTELVHVHLPKLTDRGWLTYRNRTTTIRYPGHDTADPVLDEVRAVL